MRDGIKGGQGELLLRIRRSCYSTLHCLSSPCFFLLLTLLKNHIWWCLGEETALRHGHQLGPLETKAINQANGDGNFLTLARPSAGVCSYAHHLFSSPSAHQMTVLQVHFINRVMLNWKRETRSGLMLAIKTTTTLDGRCCSTSGMIYGRRHWAKEKEEEM